LDDSPLPDFDEMIHAAWTDPTLPPIIDVPLPELRLKIAINAAIKTFGYNGYTSRLARWFQRNPQYNTDSVPLELLGAEIRKALGWES